MARRDRDAARALALCDASARECLRAIACADLREFNDDDVKSMTTDGKNRPHASWKVSKDDARMLTEFMRACATLDGEPWKYVGDRNGAHVFARKSSNARTNAHEVLGACEIASPPSEVFEFFSKAEAFDRRFKALDRMFKRGDVLSYALYDDMRREGKNERQVIGKCNTGGVRMALAAKARELARDAEERFRDVFEREGTRRASGERATSSMTSDLAKSGGTIASSRDVVAAVPKADVRVSGKGNPLGCAPGRAVLRGTFKLPSSVIKDRDFVWDQLVYRAPNGSVIVVAQSVDENDVKVNALAPVEPGHVRGSILVSGYYAVPNARTGGSTVYYAVQVDPKGALPMWVVNLVAPDQAQNVARLRDYLDGRMMENER